MPSSLSIDPSLHTRSDVRRSWDRVRSSRLSVKTQAASESAAPLLEALVVVIVGLVEEEVGRELLVLVARKVRLDGRLAAEAEPAEL